MTALVAWCFRRAPWVLACWLLALGGLLFAAQHTGVAYRDTVALPAADSSVAADLLRGAGGDRERVVMQTADSARVDALAGRLRGACRTSSRSIPARCRPITASPCWTSGSTPTPRRWGRRWPTTSPTSCAARV